jgi:hypothetical protein
VKEETYPEAEKLLLQVQQKQLN